MKKITLLKTALLFASSLALPLNMHAQDGALDLTFDTDGIVSTPIGASDDYAYSVAVQADGKIVVAGRSSNGSNNDFALTRYNTNGSLDLSFDTDGRVTTPIGSADDFAFSVVVQADGKIVVAGCSYNGSNNDFALTRYNSNGSLDLSFDTDGIVTTPIGASNDYVYSVAVQADGKIVATGYSDNGSSNNFALTRYNTNGSLDLSFDTDGIVTTPIGTFGNEAYAVTLQADGKIVVAGFAHSGSNFDFALTRYNTNGSLDLSFDTDGIVTTPIGTFGDEAYAVAVQADGKIVVAGRSYNGANDDFALTRYNTNGSLDLTFDTDGIVTTPVGTSDDLAYSVAVQANGKIVVAGFSYNGSGSDIALTRYTTNGSLDLNFDTDGIVTTPVGTTDDFAYSVAVQTDGKIVVAGRSYNGSDNDFVVVRYNSCSATTSLNALTITANQSSATYQWIDCNTNTAIGGETNQSYTATANGSYAVVVTLNGCSDTSACVIISTVGINQYSKLTAQNSIYPNPFSVTTTFQLDNVLNNATLTVYNTFGQTIKEIKNINGQTIIFHRDNLESGLYFIHLTQDNKMISADKLIITD